jgi:hypothetical protein
VTAVCQAAVSGELFLGFESGQVVGYRPRRDRTRRVAESGDPVISLVVDPEGQTVVALRKSEQGTRLSYAVKRPDGSFRSRPDDHISVLSESWLTPIVPWGVERLVGLGDGHDLMIVDAVSGMHWERLTLAHSAAEPPATALLLPVSSTRDTPDGRLVVLSHDGPHWIVLDVQSKRPHPTPYSWRPGIPGAISLRSVTLTWRHVPPFLELVGLDRHGAVYASQFYVEDGVLELLAAGVATTEGGYLAATRSGTNTVVAVSRSRIDWLTCTADRVSVVHELSLPLPSAVACFPSSESQEILVVCSDGFVARVAAPRRSLLAAVDPPRDARVRG